MSRARRSTSGWHGRTPVTPAPAIRVLMVDDHPVLGGHRRHSTRNQVWCSSAKLADGHEAVQHPAIHRPDIVLMDLQMPVMNGTDAIGPSAPRALGAHIIVLTTFSGDVRRDRRSAPARAATC